MRVAICFNEGPMSMTVNQNPQSQLIYSALNKPLECLCPIGIQCPSPPKADIDVRPCSTRLTGGGKPTLPTLSLQTFTLTVICSLEQLHLLLGCDPDNGIWMLGSKDLLAVSKAYRAVVSESQLVQRALQK